MIDDTGDDGDGTRDDGDETEFQADDGSEFGDDDGTEFTHDADADSAAESADHEPDDRAGPLGDLASAVEGSADDDADAETAAFDDLFDRRDTAEMDADRLWEELEEDDLPAPTDAADGEVREVDKRAYCQGCEYLTEPPEVACTHEDAEILAVPTIETVRVADCPFVLADEAGDRER